MAMVSRSDAQAVWHVKDMFIVIPESLTNKISGDVVRVAPNEIVFFTPQAAIG
jgi:hypothetical protein